MPPTSELYEGKVVKQSLEILQMFYNKASNKQISKYIQFTVLLQSKMCVTL